MILLLKLFQQKCGVYHGELEWNLNKKYLASEKISDVDNSDFNYTQAHRLIYLLTAMLNK